MLGVAGWCFLLSDFLFFIFLNFDCVHLRLRLLANCELEVLKANEAGVLVIADLVVDLLSFCNLKIS